MPQIKHRTTLPATTTYAWQKRERAFKCQGDKIRCSNLDGTLVLLLPRLGKKIRMGKVWAKCLKRSTRLISVEYLRSDSQAQSHKLYFCTDIKKDWTWTLERYALRFQIEFIFRDTKQFAGLTHWRSTDKTKLENHFDLALGVVSVAKTAQWLSLDKEQRGSFSMAKLKACYHNLALVE